MMISHRTSQTLPISISTLSVLLSLAACVETDVDDEPIANESIGEHEPAPVEDSFRDSVSLLQLTVVDESARASELEGQLTNNPELDALLEAHHVTSYRQAYAYSELQQLLDVYELQCSGCNVDALLADLEANELVTAPRVIDAPIALGLGDPDGYDPADPMWHNNTAGLWHLTKTKADLAWTQTLGDPDVLIAVIDAGFEYNHQDLAPKLSSVDPYTGNTLSQHWHGTATAAMAAGETAEAGTTALGDMPSVGFDTSLTGMMWGSTSAAHYAALAMDADVISISWFSYCSPNYGGTDQLAIQEILDHGTTIVAAAGNGTQHCNGQDVFPFSALYDDRVIVVTSTTSADTHVEGTGSHSHYPRVDLAAPGRNLRIAYGSGYTNGWGTSFSTPLVAGTVGLMKSVNACLAPAEVEEILKESTDPIVDAASFPGLVGTGRLNANRAVALAQSYDYACLRGGSFDGANCYMGTPPAGTSAFIWNGAYYHTPVPNLGNPCPMKGSWFDGANCYWRPVPPDVNGFIWSNAFYYQTCAAGGWTDWLDRDDASGSGDWETLSSFTGVCANPTAIQCRATDGTYWTQTGEILACDRNTGLFCVNANQSDGMCEDYEVRFFCP